MQTWNMFRLNYHSWTKTRLRLVTVSLFPFSLCVFVCMREIPFVLFHFQILVFLQTTVISSFLLIISVYFSCYILPLCFKFSSLFFLFLLLQTFFFLLILLLVVSLCDLTSVCLSLPSVIFPLPLESLYLSHSLSLQVSRHCSVFPQCLVTVADFLSIQLLIGTT